MGRHFHYDGRHLYFPYHTFFAAGRQTCIPRWFKTWLTYVPTAIFGALVLPDVFLPAGSLDLGLNNLYLWSTVIIFPLVYKTKSLGLAIVSGAAVFALLQAVL